MNNGSYKNLVVWQKAIQLAKEVYSVTEDFPKIEQFGLISQMRRCVVSIASNIAEGSKRQTNKDFRQFLSIAYGSGAELETQLIISKELGYLSENNIKNAENILEEIMKMLNKMMSVFK